MNDINNEMYELYVTHPTIIHIIHTVAFPVSRSEIGLLMNKQATFVQSEGSLAHVSDDEWHLSDLNSH